MSHANVIRLSHCTKLLLLLLIVIATEFDSKLAVYAATAVWLELTWVINVERKVIGWFSSKLNRKGVQ